MVVLEVYKLTGYVVTNLDKIKAQSGGNVMRIDDEDEKLVLYFNELTKTQSCVNITFEKNMIVNNVQSAQAKLYRYYDTKSYSFGFYQPPTTGQSTDVCKECPKCCENTNRRRRRNV